jgi:hypothetical protein
MKPFRIISLVPFLLLLPSCSAHGPSPLLSEKKFASVYAALTEKSVSVRAVRVDTAEARKRADSVLAAHGVSAAEVLATVQEFNRDPAQWKVIMEDALRDMRDSVGH